MNPTRRRRLGWIALIAVAAAVAIGLLTLALQRNLTYLYTPSEVLAGQTTAQQRFRLGGMVAKDSFVRESGSLSARFDVSDGDALLTVHYDRLLPDLFREGQAVIATGRMADGVFVADDVLARHDETYMPKEVADKMGQAHRKHEVIDGPSTQETP
ncbi:cytochrome C biogenesis protein CcmE [Stenotrophomonas ginsengisoli]|uniref:Cytochrome c-type biogenesis protein CcmE n=1 Tax=Stenotrophomonas ginsengisoli TaxID=336566 RepID=A0A0R0DIK9_9GAMM|nr:cytochrome c maturation protein CcmE [Stenotrophomonas ginsengisoli]KRG78167.1 cytochrome C biogenesis protein CcmE [Stenotrophomonas ginsengisoli]